MLTKQQFAKIITLQKLLDETIIKTRCVNDIDTLKSRFVALLVEIGEFANEQRCFKYWSSKPAAPLSIMLEEYVDSLHFIISIADSLRININEYVFNEKPYQDLNLAFLDLFAIVTTLYHSQAPQDFYQLLNIYFSIGKFCAFNNEDIFNSYLNKNEINHLRQKQNY